MLLEEQHWAAKRSTTFARLMILQQLQHQRRIPRNVCNLIRRIEHFNKEIGFRINKKKTKIMKADRANSNRPEKRK